MFGNGHWPSLQTDLLFSHEALATTACATSSPSYSNAGQILERLDRHTFAEMAEAPLFEALEARSALQLTVSSPQPYVLDVYVFGGQRLAIALAKLAEAAEGVSLQTYVDRNATFVLYTEDPDALEALIADLLE